MKRLNPKHGIVMMSMGGSDTQWCFMVLMVTELEPFLKRENKQEPKSHHLTTEELGGGIVQLNMQNALFGFFIPLTLPSDAFLNWVLGQEQKYGMSIVFDIDTKESVCQISRMSLSQLLITEWLPHFRERILLDVK